MTNIKKILRFSFLLVVVPAVTSLILSPLLGERDYEFLYDITFLAFLLVYAMQTFVVKKLLKPEKKAETIIAFSVIYLIASLLIYLLVKLY